MLVSKQLFRLTQDHFWLLFKIPLKFLHACTFREKNTKNYDSHIMQTVKKVLYLIHRPKTFVFDETFWNIKSKEENITSRANEKLKIHVWFKSGEF